MKYKIFIMMILLLIACNCVCAGENNYSSDYVINQSITDVSNDKIIALEDGHFNTSFSDGSNGYCIEYGEQEAIKGDSFYKVNTDYAINKNNEQVGNYIKLFFVEYTDYALSDSIRTQHYIWHFTDGFNGWRLNYTIIDNIKNSNRIIPDYYEESLNDSTMRCFNFNVLLSPYEHHQNYFTYKIFYKNKTMDTNITIKDNITNITNNITTNATNNNTTQYIINKQYNSTYQHNKTERLSHMHKTGLNPYIAVFCCMVLIYLTWKKRR